MRGPQAGLLLQDPGQALNPVRAVWAQVSEAAHLASPMSRSARRGLAERLLSEVGLTAPGELAEAFPHQLSGGSSNASCWPSALAARPRLLVADEPTSALDAVSREEVLALLEGLQHSRGLALLAISHELRVVERLATRAVVVHAGETAEACSREALLEAPLHPYSQALVAIHRNARQADGSFATISGDVPPAGQWSRACRFSARCPVAFERCRAARPALEEVSPDHLVRCFLAGSGEETGDSGR